MSQRIHVAVGVIISPDKGKVLITKRTAKQHLAGLWEFPGGKIEKNEEVVSALCRELNEELGIVVKESKQLTTVSHDYPDKKVLLDVWLVSEWSGQPHAKENQEIAWASIVELNSYTFPEANKHIVQTLLLSPLYLISPPVIKDINKMLATLEECFSTGLRVFQLRLDSCEKEKFSLMIEDIKELAERYEVTLIINGIPSDIDKYKVRGIHLKSRELLNYKSRPISEEYILGASCHDEEELYHAEKINVNYAFISPVQKTESHPEAEAIGWNNFSNLCRKVKFPVYALGGMRPSDLDLARTYNAFGVAMIGSVWNAKLSVKGSFNK